MKQVAIAALIDESRFSTYQRLLVAATALLAITGLAVACALLMSAMPLTPRAWLSVMVMFAVSGALLNAVQATMYALAAHVFPTAIRGTGVGVTVAVGRIGNVAASYAGTWALSTGGPPLYFQMWAAALTLVFVFLSVIRRHIPSVRIS